MPTWGTLIGLLEDGVPRYGMMSQPFVGDRFIGGGGRAELVRADGVTPLRCRHGTTLAAATLFATTTPEMFAPGAEAEAFEALSARVRLTRSCRLLRLLAARGGYVDLVVEANLGYYDVAPVIPIVEAAGGVVSDWAGRPLRSGGRAIAAADAALHEQALALLAHAL